jgi:outer membrane protein TolC
MSTAPRAFLLLCLLSGPVAVGTASAQAPSTAPAKGKPVVVAARPNGQTPVKMPTLAELRTERRKLLEQLYQLAVERQRQGTGSPGEVAAARLTLLDADLEMTTDRAKRITLLEEVVRIRREQEETVIARVQSGVATQSETMKAKVARLDAEIALRKEQAARR